MSGAPLSLETMRVAIDTASSIVGGTAGQAALACFAPPSVMGATPPHPIHLEAASRIAERARAAFQEAMKEETPRVRDALGDALRRTPCGS